MMDGRGGRGEGWRKGWIEKEKGRGRVRDEMPTYIDASRRGHPQHSCKKNLREHPSFHLSYHSTDCLDYT